MAQARLEIDLGALAANWQALDRMTTVETAATVKANGYGLGAARVAEALAKAGARRFFSWPWPKRGAAVRAAIGPDLPIHVYGGHMAGDAAAIRDAGLIPMLNSVEATDAPFRSAARCALWHSAGHRHEPLGNGTRRMGQRGRDCSGSGPCADYVASGLFGRTGPRHERAATGHLPRSDRWRRGVPRSLSATGGVLLGRDYHFDLTRPGIGLYGGRPFTDAQAVVRLSIPVIQTRVVQAGESVGYGNSFVAPQDMRVATIAAGYADGIQRALSGRATLWAGDVPCPLLGRVSMDLLTIDVSAVDGPVEALDLLGPHQGVDALADVIGTIGYEVLTGLGPRYERVYLA